MVGPHHRERVPSAPAHASASPLWRSARSTRASCTTSPSPFTRARSWASSAWSAPAAPRSSARSSARTRSGDTRCSSTASPSAIRDPQGCQGRGPRASSRRTGSSRASSCRSPWNRTSPWPAFGSSAGSASSGGPSRRAIAARQVEALAIKTPSTKVAVRNLSGGNQQKCIVGRWLEISPRIFIMDEPTRGIDVGAKYEIYTPDEGDRGAGRGDHPHLLRAARGAEHEQPGAHDLRGPDHGGVRSRVGLGRRDHERRPGDGPEPPEHARPAARAGIHDTFGFRSPDGRGEPRSCRECTVFGAGASNGAARETPWRVAARAGASLVRDYLVLVMIAALVVDHRNRRAQVPVPGEPGQHHAPVRAADHGRRWA